MPSLCHCFSFFGGAKPASGEALARPHLKRRAVGVDNSCPLQIFRLFRLYANLGKGIYEFKKRAITTWCSPIDKLVDNPYIYI